MVVLEGHPILAVTFADFKPVVDLSVRWSFPVN